MTCKMASNEKDVPPEPYEENMLRPIYKADYEIREQIRHFCECDAVKHPEREKDHAKDCLAGFMVMENLMLGSLFCFVLTEYDEEFWEMIKRISKKKPDRKSVV